ncbi:MAG: PAS domain S-box-containing protein [Candidatus Omnitrophota bacterium]|jgi:PAS domain S-box-containing protein
MQPARQQLTSKESVETTRNRGEAHQPTSQVVFAECRPDGSFLYGQAAFADALDYPTDACPETVMGILDKENPLYFQQLWDRVINGHTIFLREYAAQTAAGESRSFGLNIFPVFQLDGQVEAMRVILTKLDAQKELSYALESAEERFSTIFLNSSDLILIVSPALEIVSANPAFERRLGLTTEHFFRGSRTWDDVIIEEHRTAFRELLETCTATQQEQNGEYLILCAERPTWFNVHLHVLHNEAGELKGILCIARDIQLFKETEEALREEARDMVARHKQAQTVITHLKEFLTSIHQLPREGVPYVQGLGQILSRMYPGSFILMNVEKEEKKIVSEQDLKETEKDLLFDSVLQEHVRQSEGPLYCNRLDATPPYSDDPVVSYLGLKSFLGVPMRDSDAKVRGTILLMNSKANFFGGEDVELLTVAALMAAARLRNQEDETYRNEIESHLRHTEKMQAVGKLAGGIAHDFNNILSGILGFSSYLANQAEPGSDLHRDLSMIVRSAERASDLTRQLLSISRKRHIEKKPVEVNAVLHEVKHFIKHSVTKQLKVEVELPDDLNPVLADEGQLHQVFMNLCINASDAMGRKNGTLKIASIQRVLTAQEIRFVENHSDDQQEYVIISFADTGSGIQPEIMEHLFEPFFTTKAEDEGTGLGLSMVYGILNNHDGGVSVTSELGAGSTFTVYLPCCEPLGLDHEPRGDRLRGTESILIVDDDQIVREIAQKTLRSYGYQTEIAPGGEEAIQLIAASPLKYKLVVMDLTMPNKSGMRTLQEVFAHAPDIAAVIISAFATRETLEDAIPDRKIPFIQKPFKAEELAREVRKALDAATPSQ